MKKALFIGTKFGNGYLQYKSLKFFFDVVDIIEPVSVFKNKYILKFFHHFNSRFFSLIIYNFILSKIKKNYDLIYVKSGEYLSKKLVLELKKKTKKIVYYCNDNPFVGRDKKRWDLFIPASKFYDLLIFQDKSRIKPAKKLGLKNIFLTLPPYDSKIHKKKKSQVTKKKNDVVFVGTWFHERGVFFRKLIDLGLNIKIYGTRWNKDPYFNILKPRVHLGHLKFNKYTKIIQNSKIAIALYSEGNKDNITARSMEIPAIGTLMLSKKTLTMSKLFKENKEVVFFNTPEECYKKCIYYINNSKKREIVAKNGYNKVTKRLSVSNVDLIKKIIKIVFN